MKTELITDKSLIEIQRYLRRIRARLLRCIPRNGIDHRGHRVDSWLIMYIQE